MKCHFNWVWSLNSQTNIEWCQRTQQKHLVYLLIYLNVWIHLVSSVDEQTEQLERVWNSLPTLKHESCSCYKCKLTWNSKNSVISLFLNHFFQTCVQRIWQLSSPKKDIMLCFNLQSNDVQSQSLSWVMLLQQQCTHTICGLTLYYHNLPYKSAVYVAIFSAPQPVTTSV